MVALRVWYVTDGPKAKTFEAEVKLPKRWRRDKTVTDLLVLVQAQLFPTTAPDALEVLLPQGDVVVEKHTSLDELLPRLEEDRVVRVRPTPRRAGPPAPDLPTDVLNIIFAYARAGPRAGRVNRRWREANRICVPRLRVSRDAEERHAGALLDAFGGVRELSMKCCLHLDVDVFQRAARTWGASLRELDLGYVVAPSDQDLADVVIFLPRLERLRVPGTRAGVRTISTLRELEHLEALDASFCEDVDDQCVLVWVIQGGATKLRELSLSWYEDRRDTSKKIGDATLAAISSCCPRVERLALDYRVAVHGAGLRLLPGGLKHLSLTSCPGGSPVGLRQLLARSPELSYLGLADCVKVTDGVLRALPAGVPLREISLWSCHEVTDDGVAAVARAAAATLEKIDLSCCWRCTVDAVDMLAHHCKALTTLRIAGCASINKAEAQRIVAAKLGGRCTLSSSGDLTTTSMFFAS